MRRVVFVDTLGADISQSARLEVSQRFDEVYRRFDAVDQRFDRIELEIRDLGAECAAIRSEKKAGFQDLHRLIVTVGGGLIGTVIVAFAGLVATQL